MHILIVKIGALGDVIMALPILNVIRNRTPDAEITWICGEDVSPLVHSIEGTDRIIPVNEERLLTGNVLSGFIVLFLLWLKLIGKSFDLILIGHSDPRYRWICWPLRAREKRSFTRNTDNAIPIPGRWHVTEYIRLYTQIDGPEMVVGAFPTVNVTVSEEIRSLVETDRRTIVLTPGGAQNRLRDDPLRRWPVNAYSQLSEELLRRGYQVVLTGTSSDQWTVEFFNTQDVINLIGHTTLMDLAALYQSCDAVVTHDSGPMHLAALCGTRTVGLFGPTNPDEKTRYPSVHVIWGGGQLACRPCYNGRTYSACADNRCLQSISVDQVVDVLEDLLKTRSD